MSIIYCFNCDKYIDTDYDTDHCEHRHPLLSCWHCEETIVAEMKLEAKCEL